MARRLCWGESRLRGIALLALVAAGASLASCGMNDDDAECHPPCPLPGAIRLSVTAAGGGAVQAAVVTISGRASGTASCRAEATASICNVMGYAGVYELEVSAPGFVTQKRSVTVAGTMPDCGCPTTATVDLDLALTPIGAH